MSDKYVLITGVCGETGSYLAEECLRNGEIVIGVDNLFKGTLDNVKNCINNDNFVLIIDDLRNIELYPSFWYMTDNVSIMGNDSILMRYNESGVLLPKIDEIYNLGAVVETRHFYESPHLTYKVNCEGAIRLFDEARKAGVKKFVNASSSEIYGHGANNSVVLTDNKWKETEMSVYDSVEDSTRWSYAHGKILTEYYMNYYKDEIEVCHLRYANCAGRRDINPEHIIPYLVTSIVNKTKIVVNSNPDNFFRSYLAMEDAAEATYLAMQNMISGEAYNIGTQEVVSISELIDTVCDVMNVNKSELEIEYSLSRPGDPKYRCLDCEKANKELNWSSKYDLRYIIKSVYEGVIDSER